MRRVLVVDDDPDLLEVTSMLIQSLGFKTFSAENASSALKVFSQEDPGQPWFALVCDYNMPGMTGAELMREVKSRAIPIQKLILVSGYVDQGALRKEMDSAGVKLISKPYAPEELMSCF